MVVAAASASDSGRIDGSSDGSSHTATARTATRNHASCRRSSGEPRRNRTITDVTPKRAAAEDRDERRSALDLEHLVAQAGHPDGFGGSDVSIRPSMSRRLIVDAIAAPTTIPNGRRQRGLGNRPSGKTHASAGKASTIAGAKSDAPMTGDVRHDRLVHMPGDHAPATDREPGEHGRDHDRGREERSSPRRSRVDVRPEVVPGCRTRRARLQARRMRLRPAGSRDRPAPGRARSRPSR